jgi:hypothetical protein
MESPKIDTRDVEDLEREIKELISKFVPEWKPGEGDVGLAFIKIFSHMTKEVIDRLNRVPEKYFGAFLEMLGISLLPASAAKVPVTFCLSEGAGTHVMIPRGTPAASGDIMFETQKNMWATPAKLIKIFALDGKKDEIYSLPLEMANGYELFKGENLQAHILFLGDEDLFNTEENAGYELSGLTGPFEKLTWEYGGEEGWYSFDTVAKTNDKLILEMTNKDEIKDQEINGIESKWIRCIYKHNLFEVAQFQIYGEDEGGITVAKSLDAGENEIFTDAVFCNETPVDLGTAEHPNPIYPFGNRPARYDTIYIGSREAFSKKGGQITLHFDMAGDIAVQDESLRLSWEYSTLDGWKAIQGLQTSDETGYYRFLKSRNVSFVCPADIQLTNVGGQENYWICIRIIDGGYGKEMVYDDTNQIWVPGVFEPPVIKKISIHYKIDSHYLVEPTKLQHCITFNNLEYKNLENSPFCLLEEQYRQRTLLLGFDEKIEKGPISIYFSFAEHESQYRNPAMSLSKVLWQYYIGDDQWKALETVDNTNNMTRSGTLEFFVPPDFAILSIFNRELYWIKAVGIMEENDLQPAPKIKGIHLNTTMAVQVESIEDEILGSGEGTANQEFSFLKTPVASEEIWVNETNTLTGEEKQVILAENGEDVVREIEDETSGTTEVLVRWQAKEDFFESSSKSRYYVIDRANGRVRFGNGLQGMIPPAGRDNIIANYYVGGGTQGNVNAFEISDMKTSIPYVDEVSNPEPAEGGSDTEQMQGVFKRGPYMIKHRERAVTREDFERLAVAASPYIARTKCLKTGNKLKIIVIPRENSDKPSPSSLLLKTVEKHLISRSLNLLSPGSIDVSRPQYVEVSIEVEVVPVSIDIAVPLEAEVLKQLKEFLHPLLGGPEKSGWEFGRGLQISDVYALLESIKGVDHVEKLLLNGKHQNVKVKPDETLCSGQHKITMTY